MQKSLLHEGVILHDHTALLAAPEAVFANTPSDALSDRVADLNDLAALYLQGARRLVLRAVKAPEEGPAPLDRLRARCRAFNTLLASRDLEMMALTVVRPDRPGYATIARAFAAPPKAAKRRLFTHITELPPEDDDALPLAALIQLQQLPADAPLFAAAPRIDPDRCTGCDGCTRVCPEGSLTLIKAADGRAMYRVDPATCSGCGLCRDVCDADAVTIRELSEPPRDVALYTGQCRACGVTYHETKAHEGAFCAICRVTNHHKNLYQVLD